jgi:phosphoribosylamine--glycine ligase
MGDPETQPIVARMDFDLAEAVLAAAEGKLKGISPKWKPEASVCVVLASRGYPGSYETGKQIRGLDKLSPGVVAFHAGTRVDGSNYYTAGGRVLGVTGTGATLQEARTVIYDNISNISFDGLHFRRDIGLPRSESSAVAG